MQDETSLHVPDGMTAEEYRKALDEFYAVFDEFGKTETDGQD